MAVRAQGSGVDDLGVTALLLLLSIFFFIANPIGSAFGRYPEQQADLYGLEVNQASPLTRARWLLRRLTSSGEVDLGDPEPHPADMFLFYSQFVPDRVQFAFTYDPWSHCGSGDFVK
jgi:Zn-dependent protease with chaperone function